MSLLHFLADILVFFFLFAAKLFQCFHFKERTVRTRHYVALLCIHIRILPNFLVLHLAVLTTRISRVQSVYGDANH